MNRAATGQAIYQQGELHRLRGDFEAAEAAYREASGFGREPQPGLSLLRLAQGDGEAAAGMIRRAVGESVDPLERAVLLPAHAEIMLAVGDLDEARRAAEELAETAAAGKRAMLQAIGARVLGAVELAEGDAQAALAALRRSARLWQELDAPYEVARVRVLIGLACRALGDEDVATMELDAARERLRATGRCARPRAPRLAGRVVARRNARAERAASWRCSAWSRPGRAIARSRRSSSSASTRSPATCRTSSRSSASRREPRRRRSPSRTGWSELQSVVRNDHGPAKSKVGGSARCGSARASYRARNDEKGGDMAVAMMVDNPEGSQETYQEVRAPSASRSRRAGSSTSPGRARTAAGAWSRCGSRRRRRPGSSRSTSSPRCGRAGIDGPPPPREFWPVHNAMR